MGVENYFSNTATKLVISLPNKVHPAAIAVTIGGMVNAEILVTVVPISKRESPITLRIFGVGLKYCLVPTL